MRREIRRRRTIVLIAAALLMLLSVGVYASVPKGVAQINLMTEDGENVAGTLEIYVGTETQLTAKVLPETFAKRTVRYDIADEQIATVDENGLLKALSEGETLLTVECGGTRQNYSVKAETAIEDITGLDEEITLTEGDELQLEPKVKMAEKGLGTPQITYKVKRNTIASVDNDGLVTALKEGETTITVSAGDVTKKLKVIVEAAPEPTYTPSVVTATDDGDDDDNNKATKKTNKKNKKKNGGNSSGGNSDGSSGGNSSSSGGDSSSSGGSSGGDSSGSGGSSGGDSSGSDSSGGGSGGSGDDAGSGTGE